MSELAELVALNNSPFCVGTLASHITAWQSVSAPELVIHAITKRYRLLFARKPPHFNGVVSSHTEENSSHILKEEISSLLEKGAVQVVPQHLGGVYSRYLDASLHAILDLRV